MNNIEQISELSARLSETFIDIAAIVWSIKQDEPEQFKRIWVDSPLGKRHTFALAAIGRMMQEFDLDRGRLARVGWTKAEMIASRLKPETMEALLSSAERLNARQLRPPAGRDDRQAEDPRLRTDTDPVRRRAEDLAPSRCEEGARRTEEQGSGAAHGV